MKILESYINWHGVLPSGQPTSGQFIGSKNTFSDFVRSQNITLLKSRREIKFVRHKHLKQFIVLFTEDLAAILNTGINLIDALNLIKHRYLSKDISQFLQDIIRDLDAGIKFSQALAKHRDFFPASYISLIEAAESTHQLPQILDHIVMQLKFNRDIKAKIIKALIYPASILAFTLFITIGLMAFAIPQFQSIFANFNAKLPLVTRIAIAVSHGLLTYKLQIVISTAVLITLPILFYKKYYAFRSAVQTMLYHSPWYGTLYRQDQLAKWCYMLRLCLETKLTMAQGLGLANSILTNQKIKAACINKSKQLASGTPLHELLAETKLLNSSELHQIKIGIESNTLVNTLQRLSTHAHDTISFRLENLSKWLEPVIMLLLALIAGGLIISMYLPIFKIGAIL
jgi:type IV pilus assembly protein PilC